MLEHTQELLEDMNTLLESGDTQAAGKLLTQVDKTSLRAVFIHLVKEHGSGLADAVGRAYLHEREETAGRTIAG